MSEYATRAELRDAEARLSRDIRDTERILRDRDDAKAKELRDEFLDAVHQSEGRITHRVDGVDSHLDRQDALLQGRRVNWKTWALGIIGTVVAFAFLKYGLHV
ncbi:MAG: hypothetical protein ACYC9L_05465 [Sulfuricaulis sp.]